MTTALRQTGSETANAAPQRSIVDPAGNVFRCHSDLYNGRAPIAHILDEDFDEETIDEFRSCDVYGSCNPMRCQGQDQPVPDLRPHQRRDQEHRGELIMDKYALDGHKLFWHLDRLQAWQSGALIAPIYVEVSPVSYCNHKCIFCGLDFAQGSPASLDTEVINERIIEMGKLGVKSIMFAGEGEPLLHKGLPRWVETAKGNGIDVSITTNGGPGSIELWNLLIPHLSWLRFSVDAGSSSVYSKIHSVQETAFEKTLQSIRDALTIRDRFGRCTVGVQYLMIRDNLEDIENAISIFSELGVDYFLLKPYSEHPQMLNKSGFNYSEEDISRIEEIVASYQARVGKPWIIFRKRATSNYIDHSKNFGHCRALPFWGYISSVGDFHTCSVFLNDERFKVGNIYTNNMQGILFGDKRRSSIAYGACDLEVGFECRVNCRMARINEFLEFLDNRPEHINFI